MKQTKWYQDDLRAAAPGTRQPRLVRRGLAAPLTPPLPAPPRSFGLKTVDEAGKIYFNATEGNHLEFSKDQLAWWVKHLFV